MNLAAILPHGLTFSDACQLVQTTFLGLCCFFATRYFRAVFVPLQQKKAGFFKENPYISYSSRIFTRQVVAIFSAALCVALASCFS
ncbi:hypothetical protein [Herbaspirillum huttiense]|uniref:hypothetical protein n=1 Tax=Herbaspirillum huttiense TaxID=863372 RepID=UPI0012FF0050|nr:hypothetical protein [Herbaspirillum huttiense]